jgi:hypothetical protein
LIVRTVVHAKIAERQGLEWLLANAKWPVAIFVGPEADLPAAPFHSMIESLEHADVVIGRRKQARGLRHPTSRLVRRLFSVPIADPLSPYFAVRREALAGIPLELDEPLTSFELLAKLTFALAMYHEVDVELPLKNEEALNRTLSAHWRNLRELFLRPKMWDYSSHREVRLAPQETRPPTQGKSVVAASKPRTKPHPMRRLATQLCRPFR